MKKFNQLDIHFVNTISFLYRHLCTPPNDCDSHLMWLEVQCPTQQSQHLWPEWLQRDMYVHSYLLWALSSCMCCVCSSKRWRATVPCGTWFPLLCTSAMAMIATYTNGWLLAHTGFAGQKRDSQAVVYSSWKSSSLARYDDHSAPPHLMVVKQPTKLSLSFLAQLLDVETIVCGQDCTSASTNMEYTSTFEMGCRLAVGGWTVTSIITNHDGMIHHAFHSAGIWPHTQTLSNQWTADVTPFRACFCGGDLLCWAPDEELH